MDLEDLSKSQLLLLTILVNFVVSIATGVLTVSLLDQAPTTVTQTVNRIVDHTIETVTTQVPVVATEKDGAPTTEELLTAAIAGSASRSVLIYRSGSDVPVAGVYLPISKVVVTATDALPGHVTVVFSGGARVEADKTAEEGSLKLYAFPGGAPLPQGIGATLAPLSSVKQGQTVIGLTSEGKAVTGIVAKVDSLGVYAELPGVPQGAGIVNLSGELLGISAGDGLYLPAERLDALLTTLGSQSE